MHALILKVIECTVDLSPAYKSLLHKFLYLIIYGNLCHLLVELWHNSNWDINIFNFNLPTANEVQKIQLNKVG